jgi:hypothetical protein
MADDILLSTYLAPGPDTFWKWTDGGEVLAWADGSTIAFRGEVEQVLARLAPRGLPPLGAVALLLAATRDNWPGKLGEVGVVCYRPELLAEIARGLDRVRLLGGQLRSTLAARCVLAELVFENCTDRTPPAVTATVLEALRDGLGERITNPIHLVNVAPHAEVVAEHRWIHLPELVCLLTGLGPLDPDTLALRLITGLDDVVQPAEVELTPAEQTRALIARLRDDDELSGLGRLAHDLMAAVTLPRPVSEQEDLPLGGVSDISNRGPLDRLLLSELAHDDLTLAVRVANGEALYLRREQPPRQPPRQRVILLETGLRSWGVPRVFATAVALALAATTDAHTRAVCYRARGNGIVPVDLCTRQGLVEHLAALEAEAHPGDALATFRTVVEAEGVAADLVLVTGADVLADRDFRKAIAAAEVLPLHVAGVGRDGRLELSLLSERGSKLLRTAVLNLDDLFAEKKPRTPLIDRSKPRQLPAILSVKPFPLLLPHGLNPRSSWHVRDVGVLSLARDRRLTLWSNTDRGPEQFADDIPPGQLLWASPEAQDGVVRAVVGLEQHGHFSLLAIRTEVGRVEVTGLQRDGSHCSGVCAHNGALFVVYPTTVDVFDPVSGRRIHKMPLPPGLSWRGRRFFRAIRDNAWSALSFDGLAARLEPVLPATDPHAGALLALFDRQGFDGAVGVTVSGGLYFTAEGVLVGLEHGLTRTVKLEAVSRRGDCLVLASVPVSGAPRRLYFVSVPTRETTPVTGDPHALVEKLSDHARPRSLRPHFTHIGVNRRGVLTLRTPKNTAHVIDVMSAYNRVLQLVPELAVQANTIGIPFQPAVAPPGVGNTLRVATWPDGSRVFLDSRGLLHLQSADRSIPETTLVLTDGPLSGWCSDGSSWGDPYFLGDVTQCDPVEVYRSAIKPFIERLP